MKRVLSTFMFVLLLVSMLTFSINLKSVKASGTIYVRADGSVDPPDAPISTLDMVTYTFTGNILDEIVVERDSIVVDGAGYAIQGAEAYESKGIDLSGRTNVTVRNTQIKNFYYGIHLSGSSDNVIFGNSITNNKWYGVYLWYSNYNSISGNSIAHGHDRTGVYSGWAANNTISGNNITDNRGGIGLYQSSNTVISCNNVTNNSYTGINLNECSSNLLGNNSISGGTTNFGVLGTAISQFVNDVDSSNTVDGKPIYYWINRQNMEISSDAGYVALVNCTGITVQHLTLTKNWQGILLAYSTDISIRQNSMTDNTDGLEPRYSSNIMISENNITNNRMGGIFSQTSGIIVSENNITNNQWSGVKLSSSSNSSISGNNITANNKEGIELYHSSNNSISGNNVANSSQNGIYLWDYSSNNSISGNDIINNGNGIRLDSSPHCFVNENSVIGSSGGDGIIVDHSDNATINENNLEQNQHQGLYLSYSSNCSIAHNNASNNGYSGIRLYDSDNSTLIGNIATKNVEHGIWLDYAGKAILIGNKAVENGKVGISLGYSHDSIVDGNTASDNVEMGFWIDYSENLQVAENTACNNTDAWAFGFRLDVCSNSTISRNVATGNNATGIQLFSSENCTIAENLAAYNNLSGIWLHNASDTTVMENGVYGNYYHGIGFYNSTNCKAYENNVSYNGLVGIWLDSSNSSIVGNNVTYNAYGIGLSNSCLANSSDSKIFHNSFMNNTQQAFSENSNAWDEAYPSGGNYWSDYLGNDTHSGPYQNETGSDGIGDTPYIIDGSNRDNYPLMKPYPWAAYDVGITSVTTSKSIVGEGYNVSISVMVFNYGNSTEAVNITIRANQTIIGEIYNVVLSSRDFTIVLFTWNTTGFAYGNYTTSAYAWPVQGETDIGDNTFTDSTIIVSHVGDITGDGKCDIQDLARVSAAYGSLLVTDPLDPMYGQYRHPVTCTTCPHTPNADITNDGKVDIEDLARTSASFGWHE